VKTLFLVSRSDASKNTILRIASAALGDDLRVCEHGVTPDCCRSTPCTRSNEFERAGYRVQLHTEHGLSTASDAPPGSAFLVLTEEPTIGAFRRYEEMLGAQNRTHSVELLQYWLASDAISQVDWWRSWAGSSHSGISVIRAENFIEAPRDALRKLLSDMDFEFGDHILDAAQLAASALPRVPDVKSLEASVHFVRPCFVEYMNLLAQEANYLGYAPWQDPKAPSGPVTTIYRAKRALAEKNYEEVVSLLASFAGTNAVDTDLRAMLGRALLEIGREVEGRRALEIVLRLEPDYFDGYTILAEHAYELGLNVEARGYLREAASRPNGPGHVGVFLARTNIDADLAKVFAPPEPQAPPLPISREAVVGGFQWILGRAPESDDVITDHRRLQDDEALRQALLHSQEFAQFFERFEAGLVAAEVVGEAVSREDVILALHWVLGRSLRSRAEADELLDLGTREELRLRLFGAEEFKQSYKRAA
jgi:tetratricopeptide (TPR) repeat protein